LSITSQDDSIVGKEGQLK